MSISHIDPSLEEHIALEKGSATAYAMSIPAPQVNQHFGKCSAVSLTPFPTRTNFTTGSQFLIQVKIKKAFLCLPERQAGEKLGTLQEMCTGEKDRY